ncbi:CdaR family protein [Dysosmobacter sp.]|uniref:CdaR family protein n=1 Tax=Dysosmobacter sp. TaxID=2591382 RepID=UPI002DB58F6D|nr:CdaR family protein [uncultured Oscillibacter sp.]
MENKERQRKALYIVLSILVAAAIWVMVDVSNGTIVEKTYTVPINYLGTSTLTDRGLMLLEGEGDTATDTEVTLTVQGTRWNIAKLDKDEILVQADLSDITEAGVQRVSPNVFYPSALRGKITTTSTSSYMVQVNIGELDRKTIDVRCEQIGTVAEGYSGGELQISPATLEIRGQEEDIAPVSYAKVVLEYDNATETITQMLDYQFYDENDQLVDGTNIQADAEQIQVTLPIIVTKELQLRVDFEQHPGARLSNVTYRIEPSTITVSGDAGVLRDVDSITLGSEAFDLLSLLDSGTATYSYPITVPEGCTNLSGVTRATLQISFNDMTSAQVTTQNFTLSNYPQGKTTEILTSELTVTVFGTSADVAAVTGDDVEVTVDLSELSSATGSYTVPAQVKVNGVDVGVSGNYVVQVTIRENGTQPDSDNPEPEPSE